MTAIFDAVQERVVGGGWQRRWATAVLLMGAFLCSGLLAVPVVALLDYTDGQGDALGTPAEAVDTYLLQLNAGEEIGLRRALAKKQRNALLDQWRTVLADMKRTTPPPSKLTWARYDTLRQDQDEAEISVPVTGVWWADRGMSYQSAEHAWTFVVREEDGGWRIRSVMPFAWCGGYVLAEKCT